MNFKSFLKRLGGILIAGIFMFVVFAVVQKLFMEAPNWLDISIFWSAFWFAGSLVSVLFCELNINSSIVTIYKIGVIAIVFVIVAFIAGVLIDTPNWKAVVGQAIIPFGISILVTGKTKTEAE